ncbi:MAG TPA: O-antigen ligase family protein [Patescibacteria group bacterium]|jgi:O-antigen ligase
MAASRTKQLWPVALVAAIFGSLVAGQAVRIQPFSGFGAAVSILDVVLGISSLAVLGHLLKTRSLGDFLRSVWHDSVWKWSLSFLLWAAVALGINAFAYEPKEVVVAASYLARISVVFFLAWFTASRAKELRRPVTEWFVAAAVALVGFGFLILALFPNFIFMVPQGWDPHLGRLLSTFYDPNLFGPFLALVMAFSLGRAFITKHWTRIGYVVLFLSGWVGLYLTYSRSAWLAGLIAVPAVAWKYKKLFSLALVAVFIGTLFVPTRLGSRFDTAPSLADTSRYSKQGFDCDERTDKECDPTGSARITTLRQGWDLLQTSPVIGVGYNAYGTALVDQEVVTEKALKKNSIQGSDSSLLNIWVTTGIVGLALLLAFYAQVLRRLWRLRAVAGPAAEPANALFFFTIAYLAASFLNNALFYLFLFVPWALLLAVTVPIRSSR